MAGGPGLGDAGVRGTRASSGLYRADARWNRARRPPIRLRRDRQPRRAPRRTHPLPRVRARTLEHKLRGGNIPHGWNVSGAARTDENVRGTIYRLLVQDACLLGEKPWASLPPSPTELRRAVAKACREILGEPVQARGSFPFAAGDAFDQARRDSGLFVLRHRLPKRACARSGVRGEATLRRGARA